LVCGTNCVADATTAIQSPAISDMPIFPIAPLLVLCLPYVVQFRLVALSHTTLFLSSPHRTFMCISMSEEPQVSLRLFLLFYFLYSMPLTQLPAVTFLSRCSLHQHRSLCCKSRN
jgi:hypothetical protein